MKKSYEVNGALLFQNTALNIVGKVIPLFIGVVTIPLIIQGLGLEQFGLLSLAWVMFGYFSLFDFGLGKAVTKFVSEMFGEKEESKLAHMIWNAFGLSLLLGIIGTALILSITPLLATRVFTISEEFNETARKTFALIAYAVPIVTLISTTRGILEGVQRYDLINVVKIPLNSLIFLVPAASAFFDLSLPTVILFFLILHAMALFVYLLFSFAIVPSLRQGPSMDRESIGPLLTFGGWTALSNASLAFLANIDRFFIGSIISLKAVGFYTAPFDLVTRLFILPESLITLFPAFSSLGKERKEEVANLYIRSMKHLLVATGVFVIITAALAPDILSLWLGEEFRINSTRVLQLLSIGALALSLSLFQEHLFNGLGYPDVVAKIRIVELPLYLAGLWFFIQKFGIIGAAGVWAIRAVLDVALLLFLSSRILSLPASLFTRGRVKYALLALLFLGLGAFLGTFFLEGLPRYTTIAALLVLFFIIWKYAILDDVDRKFLKKFLLMKKT